MEGLTIAEWLTKAVETEAGKQEGNLVIPSGKQRLAEPGHRQLITHQMNDARALPVGHVQRDCGGHGVAR